MKTGSCANDQRPGFSAYRIFSIKGQGRKHDNEMSKEGNGENEGKGHAFSFMKNGNTP
jgi:hypothetical protein